MKKNEEHENSEILFYDRKYRMYAPDESERTEVDIE